MKLKTLKDIKQFGIDKKGKLYREYELKAEAIKWVKNAEENRRINGDKWTDGKIFGLTHFFNITGEDLE